MSETIKKTSFYEEENNTNDKTAIQTNQENNEKKLEKEEDVKNVEQNNQDIKKNPAIDEANILIDQIKENLSDSEKVTKEYEELNSFIFTNLQNFNLYYRSLLLWIEKVPEFKEANKYTDEQINHVTTEIINILIENAVLADYNFGLYLRNSLSNFSIPVIEVKERVNFAIETIQSIMKNMLGIENPQEEYYKIYSEIINS